MKKQLSATEKTTQFFARFRNRNFTKNQIIIEPESINKFVYFIVKGRVKKYSVNYKGDEVVMTVFREGSFIPIADSVGQDLDNRFYYAADNDVETRVAPKEEVQKMLDQNPDIMMALLHRVNRALDEFLGRSLALMASSALSRVAYEIYTEAVRFGNKEGSEIHIELNERAIAGRTGLSRETVNREIRKLKDIKSVRVERRGIIVINIEKLEAKLYKKLL